MPFEIILAPEAIVDLDGLKANLRATVREALETHLRHEPTKTSRSRIKRLKKMSHIGIAFASGMCRCSMT